MSAKAPPSSLTPKMMNALRVIAEVIDETGTAPSIDEIANDLEMHKSGVSAALSALVERGWIDREKGARRSIRVLHRPPPQDHDIVFVLSPDLAGPPSVTA
jgi:SOS-response transcriptional repressor LexA